MSDLRFRILQCPSQRNRNLREMPTLNQLIWEGRKSKIVKKVNQIRELDNKSKSITNEIKNAIGKNFGAIPKMFKIEYLKYVDKE